MEEEEVQYTEILFIGLVLEEMVVLMVEAVEAEILAHL